MLSNIEEDESNSFSEPIQKRLLILPLAATSLLALLIFTELKEGVSYGDLPEILSFLACFLATLGSWYWLNKRICQLKSSNLELTKKVSTSEEAGLKWRKEAEDALEAFSLKIKKQFSQWGLTIAESEVALELLKGFSHKEIANIRNSSEKTVRLQSAMVYRKACLDGRAQLSAFFLAGLKIAE